MTREEAWRIIESCKDWNEGQKSTDLIFNGKRSTHDDVLDARRAALAEAWRTVGKFDQ
jgi:hypothetical protein